MSRYEDPEGTGDYPGAGRQRGGATIQRGGRGDGEASMDGAEYGSRAHGGRGSRTDRGSRGNRGTRGARASRGAGGSWDEDEDAAGGRPRAGRRGGGGRGERTGRGPSGYGRRGHRVLGSHPILAVCAIVATLALTFIGLAAYGAYRNVYDSIHHVTVSSGMLGQRPPKLNGSTNILIIGSDSRAGLHGRFGRGIQGSRSDTSMLLHISPTHTGAIVISFPRDTMVPVYACPGDGQGHSGQQAQPGSLEQLNSTYSYGGPACLWKTIEHTSHIHIDHFIQVDFSGFKAIVDDLGGVPVCLPRAIKDPASRLNLPAGRHTVNGAQALAFVRERHIGLGSDLQRIQRQQLFLASVAQKVKQSTSLTNPARLYSLVHDIASSLTTDSALSLSQMYAIANSMKSLSTKALQFISVPVEPYPLNPGNQVEYWQPYAGQLFHAISRDNRILKTAQKDAKAAKNPPPTVSPGKVHLQVLNATATPGLAATTAGQLTAKGFNVAGTGNAASSTSTVIEYGSPARAAEANTVQQQIPGSEVKEVPTLKGDTLQLVLGANFKGLASSHKAKKSKASVSKVVKSIGTGISGGQNICKDSAAFAGPDTPSMFGNGG